MAQAAPVNAKRINNATRRIRLDTPTSSGPVPLQHTVAALANFYPTPSKPKRHLTYLSPRFAARIFLIIGRKIRSSEWNNTFFYSWGCSYLPAGGRTDPYRQSERGSVFFFGKAATSGAVPLTALLSPRHGRASIVACVWIPVLFTRINLSRTRCADLNYVEGSSHPRVRPAEVGVSAGR